MQVHIPDGVGPGQAMMIQTPSGMMQALVPEGLKAGDTFAIQISAPSVQPVVVTGTVVGGGVDLSTYPAASTQQSINPMQGGTQPRAADRNGIQTVGPPNPIYKKSGNSFQYDPIKTS